MYLGYVSTVATGEKLNGLVRRRWALLDPSRVLA
jgi:hypothetical protein